MSDKPCYSVTVRVWEDPGSLLDPDSRPLFWEGLTHGGEMEDDGETVRVEMDSFAIRVTRTRTAPNPDLLVVMFDPHSEESFGAAVESVGQPRAGEVVLAAYYDYEYVPGEWDGTGPRPYFARPEKGQVENFDGVPYKVHRLQMVEEAWVPVLEWLDLPVSEDEKDELWKRIEAPYWG